MIDENGITVTCTNIVVFMLFNEDEDGNKENYEDDSDDSDDENDDDYH